MTGTLVSDLTNSDGQEFLKELQRRGVDVSKFHTARLSSRAMDLIGEIMRTGTITPPRVIVPTPPFDRELARRIWQPAEYRENPPRAYPHCVFVLVNKENSTRLEIGISTPSSRMTVHLNRTTRDCPDLSTGLHKPHQHLMSLSVHRIAGVEYHADDGYVDFKYSRPHDPEDVRCLRIFKWGYFYVTVN